MSEIYSIRDWYRCGSPLTSDPCEVRNILYKRLIQLLYCESMTVWSVRNILYKRLIPGLENVSTKESSKSEIYSIRDWYRNTF